MLAVQLMYAVVLHAKAKTAYVDTIICLGRHKSRLLCFRFCYHIRVTAYHSTVVKAMQKNKGKQKTCVKLSSMSLQVNAKKLNEQAKRKANGFFKEN